MNEELQEMVCRCQLRHGSEIKKIDGRWYDVCKDLRRNVVIVENYFLETITEYRVQIAIQPMTIKSTAELSPFLDLASSLEREFGGGRGKAVSR